ADAARRCRPARAAARGGAFALRGVLELVRVHALLPGIRRGARDVAGSVCAAPGSPFASAWTRLRRSAPRGRVDRGDEATLCPAGGARQRRRACPRASGGIAGPRARVLARRARHHRGEDGGGCGALPVDGIPGDPAVFRDADCGRTLPGVAAAMSFRTLWFEDGALHLLDQRRLPARAEIVIVRSGRETAQAIRDMVVRGAPAIGCAAAYGLALATGSGE